MRAERNRRFTAAGTFVICMLLLSTSFISFPEESSEGELVFTKSGPTSVDVNLAPGEWNLIGLPLDVGSWNAGDWALDIEAGTDLEVVQICNYSWGNWASFLPWMSMSKNNFSIQYGRAYMVYVTGAGDTTWEVTGTNFSAPVSISVNAGWFPLCMPLHALNVTTSNHLVYQIENDCIGVTKVVSYNSTIPSWMEDDIANTVTDFPLDIQPDSMTKCLHNSSSTGYFVLAKNPGTFEPDAHWDYEVRLTFEKNHRYPDIAVEGNYVYVVYEDDGDDEVYFMRSTNLGLSWEPEQKIGNQGDGRDARIAVNGSNVYVVWDKTWEEIFFKKSSDYGVTWGSTIRLSIDDGLRSQHPDIAVWDDNIYVVWDNQVGGENNGEIKFNKSMDGGSTWLSQPLRLTVNDEDPTYQPRIAVNDSNIHVVYTDWKVGQGQLTEVYYNRSEDNGNTWLPGVNISEIDGWHSQGPTDIDINGSNIYVVWREAKIGGNEEVYYRSSNDNGNNWNPEKIISKIDGQTSWGPSICVDGSKVEVTWTDFRDEVTHRPEIYYNSSLDGGNAWGGDIRFTTALYGSGGSSMFSEEGYTHVVWTDSRNGGAASDREIYYRRLPPL